MRAIEGFHGDGNDAAVVYQSQRETLRPLLLEQLEEFALSGSLLAEDQVIGSKMLAWQAAEDMPELADLLLEPIVRSSRGLPVGEGDLESLPVPASWPRAPVVPFRKPARQTSAGILGDIAKIALGVLTRIVRRVRRHEAGRNGVKDGLK